MTGNNTDEYQSLVADEGATCQITYVSNGRAAFVGLPIENRPAIEDAAQEFLLASHGDICVLLAGQLQSDFADDKRSTEYAVAQRCKALLGDPSADGYRKDRTIDLVLDTLGGSLDSAFRVVLYLSLFTSRLRIYVPRRAKSAGTLISIGAQELYLAPFAELGPLDTQIHDPRNPTEHVSALDCFQSVDYVRGFGIDTLKRVLLALGKEMKTGIPLSELLDTALAFANSCSESMLAHVKALDFGGWGRTLQIGERYTHRLLMRAGYSEEQSRSIARDLVYGYTHHPYPIDIQEANDLGLRALPMPQALVDPALRMVRECAGLDIAVGAWEAQPARAARGEQAGQAAGQAGQAPKEAGQAAGQAHREDRGTTRRTPVSAASGRPATTAENGLVPDEEQPVAIVDPLREVLTEQEKASASQPPDSAHDTGPAG